MATFRYKAISGKDGSLLLGELEAASRERAVAQLQDAGHLLISAEQSARRRWRDVTRLLSRPRRGHIAGADLTLFTRELATLLQAGLTLEQALQTLCRLNRAAPLARLAEELLEQIRGGASLSEALAAQADAVGNLYVNMIRAGEASGALALMVSRLAEYLERMTALRSQVVNAMLYPVILLVFSILSLLVLMTFVVPEFVPLFEDAEQGLPWLTQGVFAASTLLRQYGWVALLLSVVALWWLRRCLAAPAFRLQFDSWCLGLPGIGPVIKRVETARLCRTLGAAVGNGVPLLSGVKLAGEVIGNRKMALVIDAVQAGLEEGKPMSDPLASAGVYPELATQLIAIGEAGGQLEAMLLRVADIYDEEVKTTIKRFLTVLEPAMILGLGALIALIIVSVLLAVLSLNALAL